MIHRRLHALSDLLFQLFFQIGQHLKVVARASAYVLDSLPVAVRDNIHIGRCKLLKGEQWRGKQASMRRYFYGVKVQVLSTNNGKPVEFYFVPGNESDIQALKKLPMTVAPESSICADSAFTDYGLEDDAKDAEMLRLMIQRKSNSNCNDEPWI